VGFFHDWDRAVKAHGDALVVRYEDFRRDPTTTLATLAKFLEIGSTTEEIEEAVAFASFENLRKLEEKKTLATARLGARTEGNKDSFKVRRGKVGGYADYFQPEEAQRLESFVRSQLDVSWTDDVSADSADPPVSVGATSQPAPAISVILTTHNRCAILGRAIDSVLSQTHADFELLIVDDGSTDGTDEVVSGYTDPRIVYLPQTDHVGASGARNVGARQARGSIVCFLDSDDAYRPNKLEFVAAYFAANPDRDVLIDSYVLRGSATDPNAETLRLAPRIDNNEDLKQALYSRRMSKPTSAIGVRRAALLAVGCFDETMARRQDVDLIIRLTRHHRCATTDQVLWTKYWNEGALSTTRSTFIDATIDLCQRHPEYLRTPRYSIGLGRDLVRHIFRLSRAGQWQPLVSDLGRFGAYRGYAGTVGLIARGAIEIGRRFVASRYGPPNLAGEQRCEVAVGQQQRRWHVPGP
jgi:glycosyltransferase involved in cell wall biosynthesis